MPITINTSVLKYKNENGEYTSIDAVSQEDTSDLITNWMEENITEDPTVVIDSSLTISGAAADAKKTGDEISDLKNAKANTSNPVFTGSISLGRNTNSAIGENSVAIGRNVEATGNVSYAEGDQTRAIGYYSHAEGSNSAAYGQGSHVEGVSTIAQGTWAHTEGSYTSAFGAEAHAEGNYTSARGEASHAEGYYAQAKGKYSHAEGYNTLANADLMHAQGLYNADAELFPAWSAKTYAVGDMVTYGDNQYGYICTVANSDSSFDYSKWVQLPYNSPIAFVVGNGNATVRSNAFEVQYNGTAKAQTALQIGNTKITEAQLHDLKGLTDQVSQLQQQVTLLIEYVSIGMDIPRFESGDLVRIEGIITDPEIAYGLNITTGTGEGYWPKAGDLFVLKTTADIYSVQDGQYYLCFDVPRYIEDEEGFEIESWDDSYIIRNIKASGITSGAKLFEKDKLYLFRCYTSSKSGGSVEVLNYIDPQGT